MVKAGKVENGLLEHRVQQVKYEDAPTKVDKPSGRWCVMRQERHIILNMCETTTISMYLIFLNSRLSLITKFKRDGKNEMSHEVIIQKYTLQSVFPTATRAFFFLSFE